MPRRVNCLSRGKSRSHLICSSPSRRIAAEIAGAETQRAFFGDGYCMLEAGEDLAGFAYGNFFAEPSPQIELRQMGWVWHMGKALFEQWWLAPYELWPRASRLGLARA